VATRTIVLTQADEDRQYQVDVIDDGGQRQARIGQRVYDVVDNGGGSVRVRSDRMTTAWTASVGDIRWVFVDGHVFELAVARPQARARGRHHGSLTAPMPATVLRVLVSAGDAVTRGDSLVILEAMKMELPVRANASGTIRAVQCREGEIVQPGVTLIEIDEE
jgi:biotin carboxyl carrier protein